jgi:hypothetical protein
LYIYHLVMNETRNIVVYPEPFTDSLPESMEEESLSVVGAQLAAEAAWLEAERAGLAAEVRSSERQVAELRARLRAAAASRASRVAGRESAALRRGEGRLDEAAGRQMERVREELGAERAGREQVRVREAIRSTRTEGIELERRLNELRGRQGRSLEDREDVTDGIRDVIENYVNEASKKNEALKEKHLNIIKLAKEHEDVLKNAFDVVESVLGKKVAAQEALGRHEAGRLGQDDPAPKIEVKKEVLDYELPANDNRRDFMRRDPTEVETEVAATAEELARALAGLGELVAADRAAVLARDELPRRIGQLEQRLELARQKVAKERKAFLEQHAKDTENLNIILANMHMEQERQKSKMIKGQGMGSSGEYEGGAEEVVEAEVLQRESSTVDPDEDEAAEEVGRDDSASLLRLGEGSARREASSSPEV